MSLSPRTPTPTGTSLGPPPHLARTSPRRPWFPPVSLKTLLPGPTETSLSPGRRGGCPSPSNSLSGLQATGGLFSKPCPLLLRPLLLLVFFPIDPLSSSSSAFLAAHRTPSCPVLLSVRSSPEPPPGAPLPAQPRAGQPPAPLAPRPFSHLQAGFLLAGKGNEPEAELGTCWAPLPPPLFPPGARGSSGVFPGALTRSRSGVIYPPVLRQPACCSAARP